MVIEAAEIAVPIVYVLVSAIAIVGLAVGGGGWVGGGRAVILLDDFTLIIQLNVVVVMAVVKMWTIWN